MSEQFSRTGLLLGEAALQKLSESRVAVFGVGGVGGYVVEALARSGVGALDLVDHDRVSLSNINRQIIALHSTVGEYKVDVTVSRISIRRAMSWPADVSFCRRPGMSLIFQIMIMWWMRWIR